MYCLQKADLPSCPFTLVKLPTILLNSSSMFVWLFRIWIKAKALDLCFIAITNFGFLLIRHKTNMVKMRRNLRSTGFLDRNGNMIVSRLRLHFCQGHLPPVSAGSEKIYFDIAKNPFLFKEICWEISDWVYFTDGWGPILFALLLPIKYHYFEWVSVKHRKWS